MAIFSTKIESDERIIAITFDEWKEQEKVRANLEELKRAMEEAEKYAVNDALIYTKDIRKIFGWSKDDGLKVMF